MTVVARDIFSGDADSDITGRTPDGGLDPATGIGTWQAASFIVGTIDIVPGFGAQASVGSLGPLYMLTGLALGDDHTLRATVNFQGSTGAELGIYSHYDDATSDGYLLSLVDDGPDQFFLSLSYSGDFLAGNTVSASSNEPHTISLTVDGDQLTGFFDGANIVVHVLDPDTAAHPVLSGGEPGMYISNGTGPRLSVTLFEVDAEILAPVTPCIGSVLQAVYVADAFTGDQTDIEGRIPDGGGVACLQQGQWHNVAMLRNDTPQQHAEISDDQLVELDSGVLAAWNHEALEGTPNLGDDYVVEVEGYWTAVGPSEDYAWLACLARQQQGETQAINYPTAGTFTWIAPQGITSVLVKCWQGGSAGGGATGNPAAGGGGAGGTFAQKVVAVVPGTSYTVIVGAATVNTTAAGATGNASRFRQGATDLVVAASSGTGGTNASVNSTNGAGGTANTTGSIGDLITAGTSGSTGNFTSGASGGQGGAAAEGGGAGGGPPADNSTGQNGTAPGGGGAGGKANTTTDRQSGGGAIGRVQLTYGYGEHSNESGYEFNLSNWNEVVLYRYTNGSYTPVISNTMTVEANRTYRLKMCLKGSTICCFIDDVAAIFYDDTLYPTGTPGFCILDTRGDGSTVKFTGWRVISDEPGAPLCGNEEGGGGHQNPGTDIPALLWPVGKGAWRQVDVPIDAPTSRVRPYGRGVPRGAVPTGIYKQGAWRSLLPSSTGGGGGDVDQEGDPGDTFPDPGCGQIPTPVTDVDPVALTSRFYGITGTPVSNLNDVLTGTQRPAGSWTRSDLIACAARGAILTTAQGGYDKFMPTGRWVLSNALPVYYRMLDPIYEDLLEFAEWHFGFSFLDDFSGATIWPPSGIPVADVREIGLALRDRYPGVNFGARIKPEEFGGFNPELDFFSCQFVEWRNESAFSFGRRMYTDCKNWGALCRLDLNYIHGGSGESGVPFANNTGLGRSSHNFVCSAREIADYFTDMLAGALDADPSVDHLAGGLGYQDFPILFTIPNVWDGLTSAHNAYAALPPLP